RMLNAPVKNAIARREPKFTRSGLSLDIERPGVGGDLSDIQAHAEFAGGTISVARQGIAALVQPEIRVGRQEMPSADRFETRPQVLEKPIGGRIAIVGRRVRD